MVDQELPPVKLLAPSGDLRRQPANPSLGVRRHGVIETRLETFLIAPGDPLVTNRPRIVADLALKYRLPTMMENKEMAAAGGLLSLGPDIVDSYRRSATLVDKILNGAKPGDLPMESPRSSTWLST